jgi:hypothetical protein
MNSANTTYLLIFPDGSFEGTADGKSTSCQSTAVRTELWAGSGRRRLFRAFHAAVESRGAGPFRLVLFYAIRNVKKCKLLMSQMARQSHKPDASVKRGRGRPPTTGIGILISVRCGKELLARLDAWRAKQKLPVTRPQALRWLAEVGLNAEKQR